MRIWICVEGKSDEVILARLLPSAVQKVASVKLVGERSNISSVARTLLVKHKEPVILLANAHSLDARLIQERYTILNELLSLAAGGTPFKVILCIPAFEAVFFEVPELLHRVFPETNLDPMLMFFKARPKDALELLFREGGGPSNLTGFLDVLTSEDLCSLRAHTPLREVVEFARQVSSPIGSHTAT